MKCTLKIIIYLLIIYSISNTFTNSVNGFIALSYFSMLGVISYEVIKNDIRKGVL
ncbi:hypothetical protein [Macrococcoides bohemicum]|uniref:hypothetical protein n=1 Tax=Macrococcoides bohemicum TaxID=1903056 RepID=UPI00193F473A|nr:hypothetical protein [Macrococcus bohemicus]QRN49975.1 hypothetical protein HT586_07155 [Macrococcus bohemicus]